MTDQITLRELLREDALYRKWFAQAPEITVFGRTEPWRVYILPEEGGRWSRLDFPSYSKAYRWLSERLRDNYDACIHSKRQAFRPPVIKVAGKRRYWPCPDEHRWCVYCRRPTLFRFYRKHPAMGSTNPEVRRCRICGASSLRMKQFETPLRWPVSNGNSSAESLILRSGTL